MNTIRLTKDNIMSMGMSARQIVEYTKEYVFMNANSKELFERASNTYSIDDCIEIINSIDNNDKI